MSPRKSKTVDVHGGLKSKPKLSEAAKEREAARTARAKLKKKVEDFVAFLDNTLIPDDIEAGFDGHAKTLTEARDLIQDLASEAGL